MRCGHIDRPKYPMRRHVYALCALLVPFGVGSFIQGMDVPPLVWVGLLLCFPVFLLLAFRQGVVCRKCESKNLGLAPRPGEGA